ncbi:hypothetical protein JN531_005090 [Flagellatimonas centrodinii]|uniref:hypothetical protein n=1 Tax=Flagellatimonas centrodinii TaxID=2806210 RepID=UPI001FEF9DC3|nr:hypothetical protein [Flagellatimonas centrodinii]ULQ47664.1 hypothetical protein JN531_005090 [Flagellatimonas centrodinii]
MSTEQPESQFFQSELYQWHTRIKAVAIEDEQAFRDEALAALRKSLEMGDIDSIDGIDSPLSKRIKAHHKAEQVEMNSNWIRSPQGWSCPCCLRSKFQISRLGRQQQIIAKLVIHHDHMDEALSVAFNSAFSESGTNSEQVEGQRLVYRMGKAFSAYEEVLICEDCNNADARAKRVVNAPKYFSFSPQQISRFIRCADHTPHHVDPTVAATVWQEAWPAYDLRMKIIRTIGHAAATDTHWYEPHPPGAPAIPLLGTRRGPDFQYADTILQRWINVDTLCEALGPRPVTARNLSRWRTTNAFCPPGRALPPNFLAMYRSMPSCAETWDAVDDTWRCPTCSRSKVEATYVGRKGQISFHPRPTRGGPSWTRARFICGHCFSTLTSLKWEVEEAICRKVSNSFSFVEPSELSPIIEPRKHSPHRIDPAEAEKLLLLLIERLRE